MGCDIHLTIEVKQGHGAKREWRRWASPDIWRSYGLFGLMAGVRMKELALFPSRGYPDDSTILDPMEEEEVLGEVQHNRSWLSCEEFGTVVRRYRELGDECYERTREDIEMILAAMKQAKESRVVFGFDN